MNPYQNSYESQPITSGQYLRYWLVQGTHSISRGILDDVTEELNNLTFWDVDELSYLLYKKDIRKISKPLSYEEEQMLLNEKCKGDKAAFDRLVESHLGFVIYIARKYHGRGIPLNDLISEGNIGLINAVKNMDPSRGFRLRSFAVHYIRAAILVGLNKYRQQIYTQPLQTQKYYRIKNYASKFYSTGVS